MKLGDDFRTRYLSSNDPSRERRDAYVQLAFSSIEIRPFVDDETFALSRAHVDYDILIVGGGDITRMRRFVRANRSILSSIVKIALLHGSNPPRRARLLTSGYDDVFDSDKMPTLEAKARIIASRHRYQSVQRARHVWQARKNDIAFICEHIALSPRHLNVLVILAGNIGAPVSIDTLCRLVKPADTFSFKRSIKGTISTIRRSLKPGFQIEASGVGGYRLFAMNDAA